MRPISLDHLTVFTLTPPRQIRLAAELGCDAVSIRVQPMLKDDIPELDMIGDTPMLAAGGVGSGRQMAAALAMGAQGVWTGSLWLTVAEADVPPAQMQSYFDATSRDTLRSRSWTGKPCRMLKNAWTEAWERPDGPKPLGMPLQFMITGEAVARGHRYADKAKDVLFNPVGQIVGQMNAVQSLLCCGVPVRRGILDRSFHRRVQRLGRRDARHQRSHGIGQFLMLGIYRDRHWSPSVAAGRRFGRVPSKLTTSRLVDDMGCRPPVTRAPAAGNELGENSQRHRLLIHAVMTSACSLRAPGVVK